jgi:hypothetical protein
MPLPCTIGQNCIVSALLCVNSSSRVEHSIDYKYKLNISEDIERQLCISVQCFYASSKQNLVANICDEVVLKRATV